MPAVSSAAQKDRAEEQRNVQTIDRTPEQTPAFWKRMKQTGLLFYIVPHLAATACSKDSSIICIKGVTAEGKKTMLGSFDSLC